MWVQKCWIPCTRAVKCKNESTSTIQKTKAGEPSHFNKSDNESAFSYHMNNRSWCSLQKAKCFTYGRIILPNY